MRRAGKQVSPVTIDGFPRAELAHAERAIWKQKLYGHGIAVTRDHRLDKVRRSGNKLAVCFVNELTGETLEQTADQLVVEHGTLPADELYRSLRAMSVNDGVTDIEKLLSGRPRPRGLNPGGKFELHRIGDAVASRDIHSAILDALRICSAL